MPCTSVHYWKLSLPLVYPAEANETNQFGSAAESGSDTHLGSVSWSATIGRKTGVRGVGMANYLVNHLAVAQHCILSCKMYFMFSLPFFSLSFLLYRHN